MAGKFDSDLDEALYQMTLDGTAHTIGDVTTWGHFYAGLGPVDRPELGEAAGDFPDRAWVIVHEGEQGFVDTTRFGSAAEYDSALAAIEADFAEFEDGAA